MLPNKSVCATIDIVAHYDVIAATKHREHSSCCTKTRGKS